MQLLFSVSDPDRPFGFFLVTPEPVEDVANGGKLEGCARLGAAPDTLPSDELKKGTPEVLGGVPPVAFAGVAFTSR